MTFQILSNEANTMITIENIDVYKDEKAIFKNLNLKFSRGKSYALIGHSGSGKSTLLNIIAGLESINNGIVKINGQSIGKNRHFYKETLGYLFQNFALIDNDTIDKNLDLGLSFKKISKNQKNELKAQVMKKVQLDIDRKRIVNTLSGGEQQRIALARLILKNPNLILADEPTGSLDTENGKIVIDLILGLLDSQKTIIIATHDLNLAQKCDVIINVEDFK